MQTKLFFENSDTMFTQKTCESISTANLSLLRWNLCLSHETTRQGFTSITCI